MECLKKIKGYLKGLQLFLKEMLVNPNKMGALLPSSRKLAHTMARHVPFPLTDSELVIELGAGTGVVTQALLSRGIQPSNIIVIEQAPDLVTHLKKRFPGIRVIQGDAAELHRLIGDNSKPIKAIVSSLPLRSLPKKTVRQIIKQLTTLLQPGMAFIQFTYSFSKQPTRLTSKFNCVHTQRIWGNVPPARVEVFYPL